MSNMGYVRFQNTLSDLMDCEDHFNDKSLSEDEHADRAEMVLLMVRILDNLGVQVSDPEDAAPWIFEDE